MFFTQPQSLTAGTPASKAAGRKNKSRPATLEPLESRTLYSASAPQIIGYLPDYEFSKFITVNSGTVTSDTMAWKDLTQVNYFSLEPSTYSSQGQLLSTGALSASTSSGFDYTQQLPYLIQEASKNGVEVNVTIGGGDPASIAAMTALVESGQSAWQNFAASLKQMISTETSGVTDLPSGGVGIDLDWEPLDGSVSSVDVSNYGKMIQTIRQQMPNLRLSAAVLAAPQSFTDTSTQDYDLSPTAVQNLTSINVMDYQLNAEQAPVNTAEQYMAGWAAYVTSSKDALTGAMPVGGSVKQLMFGVPLYGVGNNGSSFASYSQIQSGTPVSTTANYIVTDVGGIDYYSDSPATVAAKVNDALDNGYGGVMAWELGQDVMPESSSTSLLSAVKTAVNNHDVTPPATGSVAGTVKTSSGAGISGVTVYLDANNNSKLDSGELHTTTNSSGAFTFSDVPVGSYTVRQVLPSGDTQSSPSSNGGHAIKVTADATLTSENFTDTVPTGSVSGTVKSSTGKALAGVTVYLDANDNSILDTGELHTTTNSSGAYSFSDVPIGTYTVREIAPAGYTQATPASDGGHGVNVTKGATLTNENFTDIAAPVKLTGKIISASVSANSTLANAFDGNLKTTFHGSAASGNWIGLDLGSVRTLTQIKFAAASADPYNMEGGIFQGCDNPDFGNGTVNLYVVPNNKAPSSTSLTTVNVSGQFRYVRYLAPGASYGDVAEIQFYGV